ncbi:MAG: nucleotidyl transferase AbiEii/AbiGii toxin family protein [Bacteroidales bacterium]|nr:nucleotidyl transferase AbiEii/AbiGii toxin family protein [Bacteroidales bacterium]
MLHRESINNKVLELICNLQEESYFQDFFLVGGTGLALQIGHRKSDDIDLFTTTDFDQEDLLERLESDFGFSMDYIENNTLKGSIDDVKVDLLSHKYQLILPVSEIEDVRIASVQDISAMKINAISNDGTRVKDFIDIYFLLQEFSISQLLENYKTKYELRNALHALKSLNYYDEVDTVVWPDMIKEKGLTWKQVTNKIDSALNRYFKSLENT